MVESVLFSLPDFAAISDEHLPLRPTIKAVNYHQSEISEWGNTFGTQSAALSLCSRHLKFKLTFPVFWVIFQILLRGKSKISAGKLSSRRLLKPFEVLINFWASVNSFIVAGFNLLHSDLKKHCWFVERKIKINQRVRLYTPRKERRKRCLQITLTDPFWSFSCTSCHR